MSFILSFLGRKFCNRRVLIQRQPADVYRIHIAFPVHIIVWSLWNIVDHTPQCGFINHDKVPVSRNSNSPKVSIFTMWVLNINRMSLPFPKAGTKPVLQNVIQCITMLNKIPSSVFPASGISGLAVGARNRSSTICLNHDQASSSS